MSLANNIKRFREEKGILQKEVATEVGLGISHYSKIENGQREASVELLDQLVKFYGISIDQIVHMGKVLSCLLYKNACCLCSKYCDRKN